MQASPRLQIDPYFSEYHYHRMTRPLASVKMMTYNHAAHIGKAIEGVLAQETDFEYELVIGEDCSTDGTREIVFQYAAQNPHIIRVVTSSHRVGMHSNSSRTMEACCGSYIAWCEGDDYWHRRDKLQRQVAYLEAHKDCGLVFSDYDYHDLVAGRVIKSYVKSRNMEPSDTITLSDILFGRVDIRTCTACAPISLVRDAYASDPVLYSEQFRMRDLQLWADLLMQSRGCYMPDSMATHNILKESISHSLSFAQRHRFGVSAREVKVYLAKKYHATDSDLAILKASLSDGQLFLAFLEQGHSAARDAVLELERLTVRQRLLYYGTRNTLLNKLLKLGLRRK